MLTIDFRHAFLCNILLNDATQGDIYRFIVTLWLRCFKKNNIASCIKKHTIDGIITFMGLKTTVTPKLFTKYSGLFVYIFSIEPHLVNIEV